MILDTRKELILSKKFTLIANFKKFAEKYHRLDTIISIVEGDDDPKYYRSRVMIILNKNSEFVKCGGKEKVKSLYDYLNQKEGYQTAKYLTFVDRDFDESYNLQDIYETPCYSIENFYSNITTIKCYLEDSLKMNDEDLQIIMDLYEVLYAKYFECILDLNVWIYGQRLYVKDNTDEIRVNLSDKKFVDFVNFDLCQLTSKYTLEHLNEKFNFELPVEYLERAKGDIDLGIWQREKRLRGKFEIQFLYLFLSQISKFMSDTKNPLPDYLNVSKRYKFKTSFSDIIMELSPYATTPNCLREYLEIYK